MYETYKDKVAFFVVYIREAHPIDGHMPMEFGMIQDPITNAERTKVAKQCVAGMKLAMPAIVDKMDDAVSLAYHGWPERLYLVGKEGKVAYVGGPGPFQFEPEELDAAIRKELASKKAAATGPAGGPADGPADGSAPPKKRR
jgi:Iodothyronine deiodinase